MFNNMIYNYAQKHGFSTDKIIEELRKYDYTNIVNQITCDTLVLDGTIKINKGTLEEFYEGLNNCNKEYKLFDEMSKAQCHSQMGEHGVAYVFMIEFVNT